MIVAAKPYLRVRSGPGAVYREIGRLPEGTRVSLVEPAPDGSTWVYVGPIPGSPPGWVDGRYLSADVAPIPRPTWRLAGSLKELRRQVDLRGPKRSKVCDGTIGDAAHRARKSDHNPNAAGVVTALDLTHDPAGGLDCQALADALVRSRDPRIKYLIWRGQIISSKQQPWVWRPYAGANRHDKHIHVSIDPDPALYDDPRPWPVP